MPREEQIQPGYQARREQICGAGGCAKLVGAAVGIAREMTEANITLVAQAAFEEFLKAPEERDAKLLAKKSLEYVKQLKAINDSDDDEREKIEKVMVLLFGEKPIGFESPKREETV